MFFKPILIKKLLESVQSISTSVGGALATAVAAVQGDVTTAIADVASVQADTTALIADVAAVQGDVTTAIADVASVKNDTTAIYIFSHNTQKYLSSNDGTVDQCSVLPSNANEIQAAGAAGAWAAGAYVEVAAHSGGVALMITGIYVTAVTGIHQVEIAIGALASEVVIAKLAASSVGWHPIPPTRITTAQRISVRTRSKAGGAETIDLFVGTHQASNT